ncbi:hypothetical protein TTHERM_00227640 (macronuclear) [Tetrahymena thermophila SB210]|uniref:Uncharacterized protein n=1 Tax=Tetrahymena thermophila (strain SB210) TaxID=312017 RepID=Q23BR8_TETTS|nr:hypothetical protein TTHERM_00227640 [Tetrahymena thermophila SB210]EAR94050.2 hypothetical protein TTHERM_00227640 [Tetrahymena thermophila SB210]|eukprot:XP_001014295.2 hypothetical protein TTHERM_00227640 [Tetrahymena thermophila SB210]
MFPFIKRMCVETLQECLMMKKSHNNVATPHAKQSIQIQDDEKRKMASKDNNVDQDDNLENDQDDDQFSTDWTTAPSTNNMVIAYESLNIQEVTPQNKEQTKQSSQKVENMEKQDNQNKKKVTKMIGKLDEEQIKTKQQDLLEQEPDYFEELNKEQELVFQEPVVNKQKQLETSSNQKSRFQDDGALDDFNANGWVDDIEIEL